MSRIFISHAVVDEPLVDALVDLLQTGIDISREKIFCSSIKGMHIRTGRAFAEYIKDELATSDFVIEVISQPYFESPFCLCELGAAWILNREIFPLLVPPMEFSELKAVLRDVQACKIDDKDALSDLRDRLEAGGFGKADSARWETKRDAFLERLPDILKGLPTKTTIAITEHQKLEEKYKASIRTIAEHESRIAEMQGTIDKLKLVKDKDDVKAIVDEHKSDWDKFQDLTEQFRTAARGLPNIVLETMFKERADGKFVPDSGWGTEQLWNRIESAKEHGWLTVDEHRVSVDDSSPKLKPLINVINEIAEFVDNPPYGFVENYEAKYDHQFRLSLRDFWQEHLGLT